jgi:hypothetical protein
MSHPDLQRRYPFPSSFNDVHRQNEQFSYVDEEYALLKVCAERTLRLVLDI